MTFLIFFSYNNLQCLYYSTILFHVEHTDLIQVSWFPNLWKDGMFFKSKLILNSSEYWIKSITDLYYQTKNYALSNITKIKLENGRSTIACIFFRI